MNIDFLTFDEKVIAAPIIKGLAENIGEIIREAKHWAWFGWVCFIIVLLSVIRGTPWWWLPLAAIAGQLLALFKRLALKRERKRSTAQAYKDLIAALGEITGKRVCVALRMNEDGSIKEK